MIGFVKLSKLSQFAKKKAELRESLNGITDLNIDRMGIPHINKVLYNVQMH